MGDSLRDISDDIEEYRNLCRKWAMQPTDSPYGDHGDWLRLLNQGQTRESFKEYKDRKDIDRLRNTIEERKKEIVKLENELIEKTNIR